MATVAITIAPNVAAEGISFAVLAAGIGVTRRIEKNAPEMASTARNHALEAVVGNARISTGWRVRDGVTGSVHGRDVSLAPIASAIAPVSDEKAAG